MGKQIAEAKEVYWCPNFTEIKNGFIQKMVNLELHIKFVIRAEPFAMEQTKEFCTRICSVQRGALPEELVGVCSPIPETLNLFLTKTCFFATLLMTWPKNSIPYL